MKYIVYRDPKNSYESFIERFCLREKAKNVFIEKKELVKKGQYAWREGEFSTKKEKLEEYLRLLPGEKPFVG